MIRVRLWLSALSVLLISAGASPGSQQAQRQPILKVGGRVVVTIDGGPAADAPAGGTVTLTLQGPQATKREIEHPFDASKNTYAVQVPADVDFRVSLRTPGTMMSVRGETLRVAPGATESVTIDLGYGSLARARLTDVPCGLAGGIQVTTGGQYGSIAWGSTVRRSVYSRHISTTTADGEAWILDPPQDKPRIFCALWASRFEAALRPGPAPTPGSMEAPGDGNEPIWIGPVRALLGLRSAAGAGISFGAANSAIPRASSGQGATTPPHLAVLDPFVSTDPKVFVDGEALGIMDLEAARALAGRCMSISDLPLVPSPPELQVFLDGTEGTRYQLTLHAADYEAPGGRRNRSQDYYDSVGGAIVARGESPGNRTTLGHWEVGASGSLTSRIRLYPGTYWVSVMDWRKRLSTIRLEPLVIRGGQPHDVVLDMGTTKAWSVAPRLAEGGRFQHFVGTGGLRIAGCGVWIDDRSPSLEEYMEHGGTFSVEPRARFRTFDGRPTEATLYGSPGANGRVVPLRAVRPEDQAQNIDLIAELPRASRIFIEMEPVAGGRFGGVSEKSDDPVDQASLLSHHGPKRSVQSHWNDRVGIYIRDEKVTGIVYESPANAGEPRILRDWFVANPVSGKLVGDGAGRYLLVTSMLQKDVVLRLHPRAATGHDLSIYEVAVLAAGASMRLWISESAESLDWVRAGEMPVWGADLPCQAGDDEALGHARIEDQSALVLR